MNLQTLVRESENFNEIEAWYKSVIANLVDMSQKGKESFDQSWSYQTPLYDKNLILQKECRYFADAFLRGYLDLEYQYEDLEGDFNFIAEGALEYPVYGFMHRDMQSRNIMQKDDLFYFIDFQAGRIGPVQYDLASLLIDPYVKLSVPLQSALLEYSVEVLSSFVDIDRDKYIKSYRYCAVARNLQILGAFGYLSKNKGKTCFKQYIPAALESLKNNLNTLEADNLFSLKAVADELVPYS